MPRGCNATETPYQVSYQFLDTEQKTEVSFIYIISVTISRMNHPLREPISLKCCNTIEFKESTQSSSSSSKCKSQGFASRFTLKLRIVLVVIIRFIYDARARANKWEDQSRSCLLVMSLVPGEPNQRRRRRRRQQHPIERRLLMLVVLDFWPKIQVKKLS